MDRLDVLLPNERILQRVAELAQALNRRLAGQSNIKLLVLLRGAVFFFVDLLRAMGNPDYPFDLVRASSYADKGDLNAKAQVSRGKVEVDLRGLGDINGRTIVVIDDIIDSGLTLSTVTQTLKEKGAGAVISIVLLDKPSRRGVAFKPDFVGFEIPDHFVVGYGLDCAGKYRTLPNICVVHAET